MCVRITNIAVQNIKNIHPNNHKIFYVDCPYGDRKDCILYNCLNPGNWKDCCFTCSPQNGYIHGVTQVNISKAEWDHYRKISEEAAANASTIKPTTTTIEIPTTTPKIVNYGEPWKRVTPRRRRRYKIKTKPTTPTTRPSSTTTAITTNRQTTSTTSPTTRRRIIFRSTTVHSGPFRPYRIENKKKHIQKKRKETTITPRVEPTTFVTSTSSDIFGMSFTPRL